MCYATHIPRLLLLYLIIFSTLSFKDAKKNDKYLKSSAKQQKYRPPGKSSPSKFLGHNRIMFQRFQLCSMYSADDIYQS